MGSSCKLEPAENKRVRLGMMLQNDLPRNRITKNNSGGDSSSLFFFTVSELQLFTSTMLVNTRDS
jgi:hypothetical protein